MVIGDNKWFERRTSSRITEFFEDCGLDFRHDGSTRWEWTSKRLAELLARHTGSPHVLPPDFLRVLRILMAQEDAQTDDPERELALSELNKALLREDFEAFFGEDGPLHVRHVGSMILTSEVNPHRPFTAEELRKKDALAAFFDSTSEDGLTTMILVPLFRQLGFERVSVSGHSDRALEYGKDVWMRYYLPTQHVLYFGIQVKKGKLDSAGSSKAGNSNMAEVYNQLLMMLGHEIFDPELNRRALVDHAIIVAGGEITKQAKNWLAGKLDATQRSQVLFMDREDILNLYVASSLPIPESESTEPVDPNGVDDALPF